MHTNSTTTGRDDLGTLLRSESNTVTEWTSDWSRRRLTSLIMLTLVGAGCFGAAMGWWRSPTQGIYVAIKFPLIILLTALGNSLLNAMLAPLLGLNISFRQTTMAILMSFAITATILGAFSPLLGFLIWNAPEMTTDDKSTPVYGLIKLVAVVVIAFAGIAGNIRLFQFLAKLSPTRAIASRVFVAWLVGNLFLGSQLTWIARPFIGAPGLPVSILREDAMRGNFYENVWATVSDILRTID